MKILMLTEIYPSPTHGTVNETRICHYFATQWLKFGHEVSVIYFNPLLPWYYTLIGKALKPFVKKNWSVLFKNTYRHIESYTLDGISVTYIPVFKKKHGIPIDEAEYERTFNESLPFVNSFDPDVIVGHWASMVPYILRFRNIYHKAKTGIVLHEPIRKKEFRNGLPSIDSWGFRNKGIKETFEEYYGTASSEFLCNSGIPTDYITKTPKTFPDGIKHFVFVGKLMALKRVENTILALNAAFRTDYYKFDIVGDGVCIESLRNLAKDIGVEDKVCFHGWLSREKAQSVIANADCFIMVSDHEAFGLVYVEAMAKGCITIGTEGQGADGIIEHGINGFLCPPKNVDALTSVLKKIRNLDSQEIEKISEKAIETAKHLTDERVAQEYLDSIVNS